MNDLISIVPVQQPTFIASKIFEADIDDVFNIELMPVVAWRVEYDKDDIDDSRAYPVTIEHELISGNAIYFQNTEQWYIPSVTYGKGLDNLLKYWKGSK